MDIKPGQRWIYRNSLGQVPYNVKIDMTVEVVSVTKEKECWAIVKVLQSTGENFRVGFEFSDRLNPINSPWSYLVGQDKPL